MRFLDFLGGKASSSRGADGGSSKQEPFKRRYKLGAKLGEGSCGTVRIAVETATGKEWACKVIEQERERRCAKEEIRLLSQLSHPNVLHYVEHHETKGKLYIVTDYLRGPDLLSDILARGSYTEDEARTVVKQLLDALAHMHERGIVHRDMKLENVMLCRKDGSLDVNIIDFGFAEELKEGKTSVPKGSLDYSAPEIVRFEPNTGFPVDIWALGVMLYSMLATKFPFFGRTMGEVRQAILRAKPSYDDPIWTTRSDDARNMVQQMLTRDAAKRPTAKDLLSHPWLTRDSSDSVPAEDDAVDEACYV